MMRTAPHPLPTPRRAVLPAFRPSPRNTREHKRRADGLIAYRPLNGAPLSQFANLSRLKRCLPKNRKQVVLTPLYSLTRKPPGNCINRNKNISRGCGACRPTVLA